MLGSKDGEEWSMVMKLVMMVYNCLIVEIDDHDMMVNSWLRFIITVNSQIIQKLRILIVDDKQPLEKSKSFNHHGAAHEAQFTSNDQQMRVVSLHASAVGKVGFSEHLYINSLQRWF